MLDTYMSRKGELTGSTHSPTLLATGAVERVARRK